MSQLEHIEAIERRLWRAADTLRANSEYASNEYFLPVMGLVFLRHAYSRYLTARKEIEPTLPSRGGKRRALTKEDFSQRSAIFLNPEAQFDYLVALPDGADRAKAKEHRDKVLMIDARNVYRKVTRKIYDFSPEQQQNLLAIVWLYRGQTDKFLDLVSDYCRRALDHAAACFNSQTENGQTPPALPDFAATLDALNEALHPLLNTLTDDTTTADLQKELDAALTMFRTDVQAFQRTSEELALDESSVSAPRPTVERLAPLAESSRDLARQADLIYKLASRLSEACEDAADTKLRRDLSRIRKAVDEARQRAVEQLQQVRDFWRQAHWLTERFPEAELCDVDGLVKLVDRAEIEANDWSLTPGRYVGVAPEEEDEDFDFRQALRGIHTELEDLNAEAVSLAATIKENFEALGL